MEAEAYLVSLDSKGKIRIFCTSYEWDEEINSYVISRYSGTYLGKKTKGPEIIVEKGKSTRTVKQQVELQWKHLIKEKLDKGYKRVDGNPEDMKEEDLRELLGSAPTSQEGVCKPMLAKQADKVTNTKIFEKDWYASRKIDGLRCLIYMGEDGELHTASRGAMNYDPAMSEILAHPTLIQIFEENPDLILDGEAYKHGWTLQQLNSIARTQVTALDYSVLQFYWYDIVDINTPFKERWERMRALAEKYEFSFNPEREFNDGELRIQFVPQEIVKGWNNMLKLHAQYVSEGWEGLVIRDPLRTYKPNGRTNDMIKVKKYVDSEYLVVDYELGLRGTEDMVFICQMEDGRTFKAKPIGDRAQKEEYVENFESEYKDKMATVKYFYYSDTGVPLQPALTAFRIDQ